MVSASEDQRAADGAAGGDRRPRPARGRRTGWRRARSVTGVVLSLACGVGPEVPEDFLPGSVEQAIGLPSASLIQRVTLTPAQPATGDTLDVRSVIRNVGPRAVRLTSTICGVQLRGSLTFADPFVRCAGYSMTGDLTAGDSVVEARQVVVTAGPGRWVLEVRQLLDPSVWVAVPLEVRIR